MADYQVLIKKSAQKEIRNLPKNVIGRVVSKIQSLGENPRPKGSRKLVGYSDYWRIRVGDYRIIYRIDDGILLVEVIAVRHRKNAY